MAKNLSDLPGLGPVGISKLNEAGIYDLMSLAVLSPLELSQIAGITELKARKLIIQAREALDMGFMTAKSFEKERARVIRLSTGSKEFDEILGGGIESGVIVEVAGMFGTGKSQLAHQLAATLSLNEHVGKKPYAVFIDTEGTFRLERIRQIAKAHDLDPEEVLNRIIIARAYNSSHQMMLVEQVDELISKENKNVKLVIVDSLTAHFRAEYCGRQVLALRQQKLNQHTHTLMRLATKCNLCVFVTNQVMMRPDTFYGDPVLPIGGNILGHNASFRILLRRGPKGTRVAKLYDSPNLPEKEARFKITDKGIEDV